MSSSTRSAISSIVASSPEPTLYVSPSRPLPEHEVDRRAVVEHVQPLALVLRRRVHRQRLVVERVRREERDDLLGELERPVVVRAVRDRDRQAVRLEVGAHGVVGPRLGRVVRRPRPVRGLLREDLVRVEREVAVHLARRDVVEALDAGGARGVEQRLRPEDVRAEEARRVDDGEAVVGLGGEVDDDLDRLVPQRPLGELAVADVALRRRRSGPRRPRGSRGCRRRSAGRRRRRGRRDGARASSGRSSSR